MFPLGEGKQGQLTNNSSFQRNFTKSQHSKERQRPGWVDREGCLSRVEAGGYGLHIQKCVILLEWRVLIYIHINI